MELYEFLYGFVRLTKPEFIVETGTFLGNSAKIMALAMLENGFPEFAKKERIWTIDPSPQIKQKIPPIVKTLRGKSVELLPELMNKIPKIDLAFLDSDHKKDTLKKELEIVHPKITKSGFILIHDYSSIGEIRLAVQEFLSPRSDFYNQIEMKSIFGLLIMEKIK